MPSPNASLSASPKNLSEPLLVNDVLALIIGQILQPLLKTESYYGPDTGFRESILRQWIRGEQTLSMKTSETSSLLKTKSRKKNLSSLSKPLSMPQSRDLFAKLASLSQTCSFTRQWIQHYLWHSDRVTFTVPDDSYLELSRRVQGLYSSSDYASILLNNSAFVSSSFYSRIQHIHLEARTAAAFLEPRGFFISPRRWIWGVPKLPMCDTLTFRFFGSVSIIEMLPLDVRSATNQPLAFAELIPASVKKVHIVRHYGLEKPSLAAIEAFFPNHRAFKDKNYMQLCDELLVDALGVGPGVRSYHNSLKEPPTMPTVDETRTNAKNVEAFDRQLLEHWGGAGSQVEHKLDEKSIDSAAIPHRDGMEAFFPTPAAHGDIKVLATSTLTVTRPDDFVSLLHDQCPLYKFVDQMFRIKDISDARQFQGDQELLRRVLGMACT